MANHAYIKKLLKEMTLAEKAAQMSQLWGENPDGTLTGVERGFHKNPHLSANAGSLLGFNGAARTIEAQRLHLEQNSHKIPMMFMTDVIHGYKTAFPSVLGLGATWNPPLVQECAAAAAAEAAVSGVHVTFSPMADLVRDARWGRVTESTGEDPYLNSLYTAAFTRGYQGDGVHLPLKIAACVKHFVGYGACEGGRDYDSTQIGDYQLYNDYLPPFKAAIDAGCEMLMPGFNALNGMPCSAHKTLLKDILRKDLAFDGTIISDCTALWELVPHGICEDLKAAAKASIDAGIEIEMCSTAFYDHLEELIADGHISIEQINAAVERILILKNKLGLFENPYKDADPQKEVGLHLCPEYRRLARTAAAESVVLLKNQNQVLPVNAKEKLLLTGPLADSRQLIDVWGRINSEEKDCITVREGFLKSYPDDALVYAPGCHQWNLQDAHEERPCDDDLIAQAVRQALEADKVILVLGEHPLMSAEAGSRAELTLPSNQMDLLKALRVVGKPVITVIISGRPLALAEAADLSDALLMAWFPGTEGGNGITDILTGQQTPVGRLPMSIPRAVGQVPVYYNHLPTGRPNTTETSTSFTNGYIDLPSIPLYPFGYGLSYTEFTYSNLSLSADNVSWYDESDRMQILLMADMTLTNIGPVTGTETVQLYLQDVAGTYSRSVKMLKGFERVTLNPGETRTVTFAITPQMLEYYIPGQGQCLEPGLFRVFIGRNAAVSESQEFRLEGGYTIEK